MKDRIDKADIGIVLGNEVKADGNPSRRLRARLDKTVELFKDGYFPLVIVSGGPGKEGFNEALVMQRYLVQAGIPTAKIWIDDTGNNTFLTAIHSATLMKAARLKSALLISQFYHLPRTRLAMRQAHVEHLYWAHANYYEPRDIYSLARESLAIYVYLLRGARS